MDLSKECKELRRNIFKAGYKGGEAHFGGMFSSVEILVSLFLGGVINIDPKNPDDKNRDRFIISKGHCVLALYAILNKIGAISDAALYSFIQNGSHLGTHPRLGEVPFIDATTGSLGHGLSYSIGLAMASKIQGQAFSGKLGTEQSSQPYPERCDGKTKNFNVYCLMGDGECQEGSVWEGALFAPMQSLDNLTVIIDYNKFQAMDKIDNIVALNPLDDKWRSFGWAVHVVDGHDIKQLTDAFNKPANEKPKVIIANTTKGKGVSFMENAPLWHVRMPNPNELEILMKELELSREELMSV